MAHETPAADARSERLRAAFLLFFCGGVCTTNKHDSRLHALISVRYWAGFRLISGVSLSVLRL
jgi:hypothetical protein